MRHLTRRSTVLQVISRLAEKKNLTINTLLRTKWLTDCLTELSNFNSFDTTKLGYLHCTNWGPCIIKCLKISARENNTVESKRERTRRKELTQGCFVEGERVKRKTSRDITELVAVRYSLIRIYQPSLLLIKVLATKSRTHTTTTTHHLREAGRSVNRLTIHKSHSLRRDMVKMGLFCIFQYIFIYFFLSFITLIWQSRNSICKRTEKDVFCYWDRNSKRCIHFTDIPLTRTPGVKMIFFLKCNKRILFIVLFREKTKSRDTIYHFHLKRERGNAKSVFRELINSLSRSTWTKREGWENAGKIHYQMDKMG